MLVNKLLHSFKEIKFNQISIKFETCHLCNWKIQLKINNDEMGVRCTRCFATPVSQMMGHIFKQFQTTKTKKVYELSSRGAFVKFLKTQKFNLTLSEYFDDIKFGKYNNGIQCQNVEELTFESDSFDICTSLEVFEHVENDLKGFKEIYRVLKSGGIYIFTVPINLNNKTIERTKIIDGKRENILLPEYHSDSIRGTGQVFCYRNYGYDIVDRLTESGFNNCEIIKPSKIKFFGFGRPVIITRKN